MSDSPTLCSFDEHPLSDMAVSTKCKKIFHLIMCYKRCLGTCFELLQIIGEVSNVPKFVMICCFFKYVGFLTSVIAATVLLMINMGFKDVSAIPHI